MTDATSEAAGHVPGELSSAGRTLSLWQRLGLAALLVAAVVLAGAPGLFAPWLPGDEFIFIVNNPAVTAPLAGHASPWHYLSWLFTHTHDDLYQPIPILTYAIGWAIWPNSATAVRITDVAIHAANALLLWRVLLVLLARLAGEARGLTGELTAWCLALVWAVHPVLASTYAADMGRTHLLSATFALLSLRFHVQALEPGRGGRFVWALVALIAAMLCKAIPGWILLVGVFELAVLGWRQTLRSPRVYLVGVVCVAFAVLTLVTSRQSGLMQEAALGLFGDPISRSLLAVWMYARNVCLPAWLAAWYLPDPHTSWANVRVYGGVVLTLATLAHAAWCWHRPGLRGVAVGWAWFWALLLPVVGLVGAREAAAVDRYLYQPLMGAALVAAAHLVRWISCGEAVQQTRRLRRAALGGAVLGAVVLFGTMPHTQNARSVIQRAERVVRLNPYDPRALEMLAAAYDFARNHELLLTDYSPKPGAEEPAEQQFRYFNAKLTETLRRAAATPNLSTYFPNAADRAQFHRRLSFRMLTAGAAEDALVQAQAAVQLEPVDFNSWKRLAHALQALGRWVEAAEAYERATALLPADPETRAVHFTDQGALLLDCMQRPDLALRAFRRAVETGVAPQAAWLGLAQCEIRAGEGARGAAVLEQILKGDPNNLDALLLLGEFHLRSHHWQEAGAVYGTILKVWPTHYAALRGYHEVCAQTGAWEQALVAWSDALELLPDERAFRSFRVWALACAGDESAGTAADRLLADDPENPFADLAKALIALRGGELGAALDAVEASSRGTPIPDAQPAARAAATIRLLRERSELPAESLLVEALLWHKAGEGPRAQDTLAEGERVGTDNAWESAIDRVRKLIEGSATQP